MSARSGHHRRRRAGRACARHQLGAGATSPSLVLESRAQAAARSARRHVPSADPARCSTSSASSRISSRSASACRAGRSAAATEGVIVEWDLVAHRRRDALSVPLPLRAVQADAAAASGGSRRWAARCASRTASSTRRRMRTASPRGSRRRAASRRSRGSYLVGADGARSAVRQSMGVAFEGFTWPERFLVVGTGIRSRAARLHVQRLYRRSGRLGRDLQDAGRHAAGLWRILFPIDADAARGGGARATLRIEKALQNFLRQPEPYDGRAKSTYRVHQRVAADFRKGRMLLVGDAAHINNPLGAFGLNGALHGAFNLCAQARLGVARRGGRQRCSIAMSASAAPPMSSSSRRSRSATSTCSRSAIPAVRAAAFRRAAPRSPPIRRAHKDYLMRSSMIWSVRHAASID